MSHISVSTNNTGHCIDLHTLIDSSIYLLGSGWFRLELGKPLILFHLWFRVLRAKSKVKGQAAIRTVHESQTGRSKFRGRCSDKNLVSYSLCEFVVEQIFMVI